MKDFQRSFHGLSVPLAPRELTFHRVDPHEAWLPRALCGWKGGSKEQADLCGHGCSGPHASEVSCPLSVVWRCLLMLRPCRGMITSLFTEEAIKKLRPTIQRTINNLLDAMLARGCASPVDLVPSFVLPLPSYVRSSATPGCSLKGG